MSLPTKFVDAHHHFFDTSPDSDCGSFNSFLRSLFGPGTRYLPADYQRDVIEVISSSEKNEIVFCGSVHVEAMPDHGIDEVKWLDSLDKDSHKVKAIVASCDLTQPRDVVDAKLSQMKKQYPLVHGIRWILDVSDENDQEFVPGTVTHVGTSRHSVQQFGTINYLAVPAFVEGFACLSTYDFSFDLQCAPCQLLQAVEILCKHPKIPVCIDHLGSLRYFQIHPRGQLEVDNKQLGLWKKGMEEMSKLPQVMVKLSQLGRVVPDWHKSTKSQEIMKKLLGLVLDWFGPRRCMTALNWYISPNISDSSGESESGPTPLEFTCTLSSLLPESLSLEQRNDIFANNACRFYGIPLDDTETA
ncbi:hypothetical protein ACA910_012994 [Epithemia clementina (nom. ined.)]